MAGYRCSQDLQDLATTGPEPERRVFAIGRARKGRERLSIRCPWCMRWQVRIEGARTTPGICTDCADRLESERPDPAA